MILRRNAATPPKLALPEAQSGVPAVASAASAGSEARRGQAPQGVEPARGMGGGEDAEKSSGSPGPSSTHSRVERPCLQPRSLWLLGLADPDVVPVAQLSPLAHRTPCRTFSFGASLSQATFRASLRGKAGPPRPMLRGVLRVAADPPDCPKGPASSPAMTAMSSVVQAAPGPGSVDRTEGP